MRVDVPVVKFDAAQQLVFGWANVAVTKDGGSPFMDLHGERFPLETLEKAAYRFVLECRDGDEMHLSTNDPRCSLVESMVFTEEKKKALGIDAPMALGWWVGFKVHDIELFNRARAALEGGADGK